MSIFGDLSNISLDSFKEDSSKKYLNGFFANGLWQVRKEPVGEFTIKVEDIDGKKYGASVNCEFDFKSSLPKIPSVIFDNILQFYRDVHVLYKSEVYISIYWDKIKQDYFLYVPTQRVSGASVHFEHDPDMLNNHNIFIVMESHSHASFAAFWSQQDIKDQAGSRLFSVIGNVDKQEYTYLLTAGANRQEKKLSFDEVFDTTIDKLKDDSDYSVPEGSVSKITEYVAQPVTTRIPPLGSYTANSNLYDSLDDRQIYGIGNNSYYTSTSAYSNPLYTELTKNLRDVYSTKVLKELDLIKLHNSYIDFIYEVCVDSTFDIPTSELSAVFSDLSFNYTTSLDDIIDVLESKKV